MQQQSVRCINTALKFHYKKDSPQVFGKLDEPSKVNYHSSQPERTLCAVLRRVTTPLSCHRVERRNLNMSIPQQFLNAINSDPGNCVLVVGAGLSHYGVRKGGAGIPDWDGLTRLMVDHLKDDSCDDVKIDQLRRMLEENPPRYLEVAEEFWLAHQNDRDGYEVFLRLNLKPEDLVKSKMHKMILATGFRGIASYNFDMVFEAQSRRRLDSIVYPGLMTQIGHFQRKGFFAKLHGSIDGPATELVLTHGDYERLRNHPQYKSLIATVFLANKVLCAGFSLRDPDFLSILKDLRDLWGTELPPLFALMRNPGNKARNDWLSKGVDILPYDDHSDVRQFFSQLYDLSRGRNVPAPAALGTVSGVATTARKNIRSRRTIGNANTRPEESTETALTLSRKPEGDPPSVTQSTLAAKTKVSPTLVSVGASVAVSGLGGRDGWTPAEPVVIYLGSMPGQQDWSQPASAGMIVATAVADSVGRWSASFAMPERVSSPYSIDNGIEVYARSTSNQAVLSAVNRRTKFPLGVFPVAAIIVQPSTVRGPSIGPPGTQVVLRGSGFAAGETGIAVGFGDGGVLNDANRGPFIVTVASDITASNAGSWSATFSAPAAAPGKYNLVVSRGSKGISRTPSAPVRAPFPQSFEITRGLTINPGSGPLGARVSFSATGFTPGNFVTATLNEKLLGTSPSRIQVGPNGDVAGMAIVALRGPSVASAAAELKVWDGPANARGVPTAGPLSSSPRGQPRWR